jgi:chemotaxis protein methyltransferase CheR
MRSIEIDNALAHAIVDTVRDPLLVLDEDLLIVAASRSFYQYFKVSQEETDGRHLYSLGDGQWDIPALRERLQQILPKQNALEAFEVEHEFPSIGRRVMVLNARKVFDASAARTTILLGFDDITDRRAVERQRDELLREKDLLLQEMQHRVANSLQIIASILLIKARTVTSEETRTHLQDAHERVLAVAAVQKHLHATVGAEAIELQPYLSQLCTSLAQSMIGESRMIAVDFVGDDARASSSDAVSLGLIVTELMINALKHAFPVEKPGSEIKIRYEANPSGWRLTVSDNGIGKPDENSPLAKTGLGTSIVAALAEQLHARVDTTSSATGTSVSVTRATFVVAPLAA